jgi:hypothetical protein
VPARLSVAFLFEADMKHQYWTEAEVEYLKLNASSMTNEAIAKHLGRSKSSVSHKIHRLDQPVTVAITPEQHKLKAREDKLNTSYGISLREYDELWEKQKGVCAICERPETTKQHGRMARLAVDHDHKTGKVRGLLCRKCNNMLGCSGDRVDILLKGAAYLEGMRK